MKAAIMENGSVPLCPNTFTVAVEGKTSSAELLRYILKLAGCAVTSPKSGILTFSISNDGMRLGIRDEKECWHDDGHAAALLALAFFLRGGRELAAPASAPSVLEQIADEHGGRILRIGRDGGAEELFTSQLLMCDAPSSAVFLCAFLSRTRMTVYELAAQIPDFTLISREISVLRDRREVLDALARGGDGLHKENIGCLRVCADCGWVNISPSKSRRALRVTGEGVSEEIASELCDMFIERARDIDRK